MIRPVNNRCFIRPEFENKSGSFFLPHVRQRDLPHIGVIVAVGDKAGFKSGDRVIYNRHASNLLKVNGELLAHVKVDDVQAILT